MGRRTPQWASRLSLDSEPFLQLADPIAGHAELSLPVVLQPHQQAIDAGIQLLHEGDVDYRRTVDANEATRVQMRLEFRHREVDDVFASARDGERQFVLREEVRDSGDVQ